jgi:hypothetical protein
MTTCEKNTKHILPSDHLPNAPLTCLKLFWSDQDINQLMSDMDYYFYMALSHTGTDYGHYTDLRATFVEFFSYLKPFIEATYCLAIIDSYFEKHRRRPDVKTIISISAKNDRYFFCYLNENQINDHVTILSDFCRKYSLSYLKREIYDFVNAAIWYQGPLLERASPGMFIEHYHSLLTLVEAAHALQVKKN